MDDWLYNELWVKKKTPLSQSIQGEKTKKNTRYPLMVLPFDVQYGKYIG